MAGEIALKCENGPTFAEIVSGFTIISCDPASPSPATNLLNLPSSVDQSESTVGRGTFLVIQELLSFPGAAKARSESALT